MKAKQYKTKGDNMLLTDKFADFLNEIEQMQKNNEKLNEDILALEKEKRNGYDKFNSETHILIEREKLNNLNDTLEEAYGCCDNAADEARSAQDYASDAQGSAGYARDEVYSAQQTIKGLLKEKEGDE